MPRKTKKKNLHNFTFQIHSTNRKGTRFANMSNHNEREAKELNRVTCRDCRGFDIACYEYIGKYHKPCDMFEWW